MNIKEKIEKRMEEIKEDFEIEDLAKMLKIFKKNTWIYA